MAIEVEVGFDAAGPEDCPTTFQETIDLLNEKVHGRVVASIIPYIRQAATPGVDQQNLIWERIDVDGRPLGTYQFYGGAWRKNYTGKIGEIVFYSGDPGVDFTEAGGKGTVGGDWDGWQICNGNNGSPNLSDKFIVGAKMDDLGVGYPAPNGPWKTNVTGETAQTGGVNEVTLTADTTYRPAVDAIKMSNWQADGNSQNSGGGLWGLGSAHTLLPADDGNVTPDPIDTLPPFYALAYVVFQGYA